MSNTMKTLKGKEIYVNDYMGQGLMIGNEVFPYSELLPIVLHYVSGGLFGHNPNVSGSELEIVKKFINDVKELQEYKFTGLGSENVIFFPESLETDSAKGLLTKVDSNADKEKAV